MASLFGTMLDKNAKPQSADQHQSCFFRLKAQKLKKRRKNRLVIHIAV